MYYYYKDNQYVGCGNEDTFDVCEVRTIPPEIPTNQLEEPNTVLNPVEKLEAFLNANPDVKELLNV